KAQARENRLTKASGWKDQLKERITKSADPQSTLNIGGIGGDGASLGDPATNPQVTDDPRFDTFGQMLHAVQQASYGANVDTRLRWEQADPRMAATGLQEGVPSEGGFLVDKQHMAGLFQRAYADGEVLNRIETVQIGEAFNGLTFNGIDETSRANGSRFGGVQAYWRAEAATVAATKPKFRQIELSLKDLMALYYATDELLKDTVALESVVSKAISAEMRFKIEDAIFNGSGAGQPLGILSSPALVSVDAETGQVTNTFVYENVCNMWSRMWAPSRLSSVWFINQQVEPQLFTMSLAVGTGGAPVYLPPGGASAHPYGTLFSRPVIPVEYAAALGTAGDVMLADCSQYLGIDKGGLQQDSSMHVRFIYNEMAYRFTFRFDGQPLWNSPLTPYKGTGSTLSPFIVRTAPTG
ncbi:hypothetical protein LCGC14_1618840, partial [marine sediment metagenome]